MQKLVPPCGTQTLCILTLCLAKKALQNDQNGSIGGPHPHLKRNIFVRTASININYTGKMKWTLGTIQPENGADARGSGLLWI
jgi:hypothetical protein